MGPKSLKGVRDEPWSATARHSPVNALQVVKDAPWNDLDRQFRAGGSILLVPTLPWFLASRSEISARSRLACDRSSSVKASSIWEGGSDLMTIFSLADKSDASFSFTPRLTFASASRFSSYVTGNRRWRMSKGSSSGRP